MFTYYTFQETIGLRGMDVSLEFIGSKSVALLSLIKSKNSLNLTYHETENSLEVIKMTFHTC